VLGDRDARAREVGDGRPGVDTRRTAHQRPSAHGVEAVQVRRAIDGTYHPVGRADRLVVQALGHWAEPVRRPGVADRQSVGEQDGTRLAARGDFFDYCSSSAASVSED
jgi:hypothetical protein